MSDDDPKPVLWVSLTSPGRETMDAEGMESIKERMESNFADEYNIVVADDRVRLATQEDLQDLRDSLDDLLPSELETDAEQEARKREELGRSGDDVMGGNEDATGVKPPADSREGDTDE